MKKLFLIALLALAPFAHAADVAISALPNASTPLTGTETFPMVQGTTTSKVTANGITNRSIAPTAITGTPTYTLTNGTGLPLTTGVTGTLPVANGGTGAATFTANNVLLGNGTSALQVVAPGTSGNVLTSNGTTWTSSASSFNGALGSNNLTGTGTANRIGTATTNDADADWMFSASGAAKKGVVIQSAASNTVSPFQVQYSDGTRYFDLQRDGNVIINQKFGNVSSNILSLQYQASTVATVSYQGYLTTFGSSSGFSANGLWTASSATGDQVGRDATLRKIIGTGTSPTVGGSCGTSPTIAGKDLAIKVTTGTGSPTSCTVTFGTAWANAPVCTANAATTTTALNVATTTTTVIVSAAALTAGEVLHVVCHGF